MGRCLRGSMIIVFVGDKPSPRMKSGAKPFQGAACEKRLKEWIDFLIPKFQQNWVHIYNSTPADIGKLLHDSHKWDSNYCLPEGKVRYITLGANSHKWISRYFPFHVYCLPHPSGRNRLLNNKPLLEKKLAECKKWLEG